MNFFRGDSQHTFIAQRNVLERSPIAARGGDGEVTPRCAGGLEIDGVNLAGGRAEALSKRVDQCRRAVIKAQMHQIALKLVQMEAVEKSNFMDDRKKIKTHDF